MFFGTLVPSDLHTDILNYKHLYKSYSHNVGGTVYCLFYCSSNIVKLYTRTKYTQTAILTLCNMEGDYSVIIAFSENEKKYEPPAPKLPEDFPVYFCSSSAFHKTSHCLS